MKFLAPLAGVAAALVVAWTVPVAWCGRDAGAWFEGEAELERSLARSVVARVEEGLTVDDFHTGSELYDGEWLFGTLLMSGVGLCQVLHAQPDMRSECAPAIEKCIEGILSAPVRKFDSASWGNDAIDTLDGGRGHAAYLGYLSFLLEMYQQVAPNNRYTGLGDRISMALRMRMQNSPNNLVETYPGEWYPVDNSPIVTALVMRDRRLGEDTSTVLVEDYRKRCVDPESGLLVQAFDAEGRAADRPRGSGTALSVFFLGHALPEFAAELYDAMKRQLATGLLGFGAMREYPAEEEGPGDIDSGPIILGFGYSATGFAIGGARLCGDRPFFGRLFASAYFAGAPVQRGDELEFASGGPLGNAIMLAMLTARSKEAP